MLLNAGRSMSCRVNNSAAGDIDIRTVCDTCDAVTLLNGRRESSSNRTLNTDNQNVAHALASLRLCLEFWPLINQLRPSRRLFFLNSADGETPEYRTRLEFQPRRVSGSVR